MCKNQARTAVSTFKDFELASSQQQPDTILRQRFREQREQLRAEERAKSLLATKPRTNRFVKLARSRVGSQIRTSDLPLTADGRKECLLSLSSQRKTSRVWRPAAPNLFPSAKQPSGVEKGLLPWAATAKGQAFSTKTPSVLHLPPDKQRRKSRRTGLQGKQWELLQAIRLSVLPKKWEEIVSFSAVANSRTGFSFQYLIFCVSRNPQEKRAIHRNPSLTKKIKLFFSPAWRILSKEVHLIHNPPTTKASTHKCPYPTFATFEKSQPCFPALSKAEPRTARFASFEHCIDPRPTGPAMSFRLNSRCHVLQKLQLPENIKMHHLRASRLHLDFWLLLEEKQPGHCPSHHPCGPSLPDELRGWCHKVRAFVQGVGSCLHGSEDHFNPRKLGGLQPLLCFESCSDVTRQSQTTGSPNVFDNRFWDCAIPPKAEGEHRSRHGVVPSEQQWQKGTGKIKEAHKDGRETLDFFFFSSKKHFTKMISKRRTAFWTVDGCTGTQALRDLIYTEQGPQFSVSSSPFLPPGVLSVENEHYQGASGREN
ncbi:TBC1 domain family member 20, partial [Ophiophagus hannah]